MFGDQITSLIRTYVAIWVPAAGSWLADLGVDLPIDPATITVTAAAISGYYTLVWALESRWPVAGRLLGSSRAPEYPIPAHARAPRP